MGVCLTVLCPWHERRVGSLYRTAWPILLTRATHCQRKLSFHFVGRGITFVRLRAACPSSGATEGSVASSAVARSHSKTAHQRFSLDIIAHSSLLPFKCHSPAPMPLLRRASCTRTNRFDPDSFPSIFSFAVCSQFDYVTSEMTASLLSVSVLVAAVAGVYMLAGTVNTIVPEPYMDEIFHVPQAQSFCAGNYTDLNPKITTPPGLYV